MSIVVAKQPVLQRLDAAQTAKTAVSNSAQASNQATAVKSGATAAAVAKPAPHSGGTNFADGTKSRVGAKNGAPDNLSSLSAKASSNSSSSVTLLAAQEEFTADPPKAQPAPVHSDDDHSDAAAPEKGKFDNVMATYASLGSISLAADVRYKRDA